MQHLYVVVWAAETMSVYVLVIGPVLDTKSELSSSYSLSFECEIAMQLGSLNARTEGLINLRGDFCFICKMSQRKMVFRKVRMKQTEQQKEWMEEGHLHTYNFLNSWFWFSLRCWLLLNFSINSSICICPVKIQLLLKLIGVTPHYMHSKAI